MGVSLLDSSPLSHFRGSQVSPGLIYFKSTLEHRIVEHLVGPIALVVEPEVTIDVCGNDKGIESPLAIAPHPCTLVVLAHQSQRVNLTMGLPKIRLGPLIMTAVTRCSIRYHRWVMARLTGGSGTST